MILEASKIFFLESKNNNKMSIINKKGKTIALPTTYTNIFVYSIISHFIPYLTIPILTIITLI